MTDLERYANTLVEKLILIKDMHKGDLSMDEIDTLNDACNLIYHNRKHLKEE